MTTTDTSHSAFARLRTLPLRDVTFAEGFWSRFREINRSTAVHYGYGKLTESGVLENFEIAAGRKSGEFRNMRFADSDLYKWLEAAAYVLGDPATDEAQKRDLEAKFASLIDLLEEAQQLDGYLNTYYQVAEGIEKRWTNLLENHELYCAGHLIQAAVAHHRSTGGERLLMVARRVADNLCTTFGSDDSRGVPGHPEIEMALVELYRETGEERYLTMARRFVERRGRSYIGGGAYAQDHLPLLEAKEVAGHAVRQLYLLAGAADIYLESGDEALLEAVHRLWDDMRLTKMSITGGVGARHEFEAFGESYELPNDRPYNETCAQIASAMTSWRLALATSECQFVDLMEWTLYNSILSGVSLDGKSYFYPNPLLSRGKVTRSDWFDCACCPPNVMRTLASIGGYFFTATDSGLQVHLYDRVSLDTGDHGIVGSAKGERLGVRIDADYPWNEEVTIKITNPLSIPWELSLRIPGWCRGATVEINGTPASGQVQPGSYFPISRQWHQGDRVTLRLQMTPELYEARPDVEAARGCLALSRGPLVYCLEGPDQPEGVRLMDFAIDPSQPLTTGESKEMLDGFVTISGTANLQSVTAWEGALYRRHGAQGASGTASAGEKPVRFRAIPYFLWANRGAHPMRVWIPADDRAASAT